MPRLDRSTLPAACGSRTPRHHPDQPGPTERAPNSPFAGALPPQRNELSHFGVQHNTWSRCSAQVPRPVDQQNHRLQPSDLARVPPPERACIVLQDLLSKGFFPRELPPPFSTIQFATAVVNQWPQLAPALQNSNQRRRGLITKSGRYSVARLGGLRRALGLPNPIGQLLLSLEIDQHWTTIHRFLHSGARPLRSASRPVYWQGNPRALVPRYRFAELPRLRLRSRIGARYLVKTDIASFYPTLYTHSIPWALHTKSAAKSNRTTALLGNRLDQLSRNIQDAQTSGIPIGPDTSLVIAELVLRAADNMLASELPTRAGFRYIDDYEIPCTSLSQAEDSLRVTESVLANFELQLNPRKTLIAELPAPVSTAWVDELYSMSLGGTSGEQQRLLLAYFSRASEMSARFPDASVLSYAVARLRGFRPTSQAAWQILQGCVLNCALGAPEGLHYILDILVRGQRHGHLIAKPALALVLNRLIERHAPLGHSSEVAWALWASLAFDIQLEKVAGDSVVHMEDDAVALLALHANALGRFQQPLQPTLWHGFITAASLYEEHWLLAYEAPLKGWLGNTSHITSDPCFSKLLALGVNFYDTTLATATPLAAADPLPGGRTSGVSLSPADAEPSVLPLGGGGSEY